MKARISLITHATEDGERIRANLGRALGVGSFETSVLRGHHDNPIEVSSADAPGSAAAAIAGAVGAAALGEAAKEGLDGGRVHLRLDKQEIAEGRLALSRSDPVKVTVSVPGRGDCLRAMGLG